MLIVVGSMACGPTGGQVTSTPDDDAELSLGSCDVTVTGAVSVSFSSEGIHSFSSDYWFTEEEMRQALEETIRDDVTIAPENVAWALDQALASDPRIIPLGVACVRPEGSITIVPGLGSQYRDVPFEPKEYEIAPVASPPEAVPGNFAAVVVLPVDGQDVQFVVSEPGVLRVETFHRSRVAGSFALKAAASERTIQVEGRFDIQRPVAPTVEP